MYLDEGVAVRSHGWQEGSNGRTLFVRKYKCGVFNVTWISALYISGNIFVVDLIFFSAHELNVTLLRKQSGKFSYTTFQFIFLIIH